MKIIKNKDNVLLKNESGEYHLSNKEFDKLGKEEAIKLATNEIEKKAKSEYVNKTINFEQARELGFCEYGIKEFCEILNLDMSKDYSINELNKKLTIEALKEYPDECIKLFGKDTLKYLGSVEDILSEDTIDLVLREEFIDKKTLHKLSVKFAYESLPLFEKEYPNDSRPRKAIEAKEAWIKGEISDEELEARSAAAWSAWSARSAAWSASSAARSASSAAAWSAAAWSARSAAAWSAAARSASSAERKKQVINILKVLS